MGAWTIVGIISVGLAAAAIMLGMYLWGRKSGGEHCKACCKKEQEDKTERSAK